MLSVNRRLISYILVVSLLSLFPAKAPLANTKLTEKKQTVSTKKFWNPLTNNWMTKEQVRLLNIAHNIGMDDSSKEHANLLQAILMQETHAGHYGRIGDTDAPVGKRSYGVMQIKLITARDVLKKHPDMGNFNTDEELLIKLMTDDYFNISIASKHLLVLRNNSKRYAQAVMAYNTGLSKAKRHWYPEKFRYVKKITLYIDKVITPFNKRFGNKQLKVAFNQ
ncbi:MAG: hypothetical protein OEX12_01760 [Gammaproteobacteria bacterium]|nr:hypothetical protein [Gammaproteobacteria bacterium]